MRAARGRTCALSDGGGGDGPNHSYRTKQQAEPCHAFLGLMGPFVTVPQMLLNIQITVSLLVILPVLHGAPFGLEP